MVMRVSTLLAVTFPFWGTVVFPTVLCGCCGVCGSVLLGTTRTAAADPCGRTRAAHSSCLREGAFLKLDGKPGSDERTEVI